MVAHFLKSSDNDFIQPSCIQPAGFGFSQIHVNFASQKRVLPENVVYVLLYDTYDYNEYIFVLGQQPYYTNTIYTAF